MKILVYPENPDGFEAEEVECEDWHRVDDFTIGIVYPAEDGFKTYQMWESQDCKMLVNEVEV